MRQEHYWIYIPEHQGRPLLIYGGTTEEEARGRGFQECDCFFEVVMLPTKDRNRASSLMKGRLLHQSGDLDSSLRRLGHKT